MLQKNCRSNRRNHCKTRYASGNLFFQQHHSYIIPDATIQEEDNVLKVTVNQDTVPSIRLNRRYLKMLDDETVSNETKEFIKQKITSAKWLVKNVLQRNSTLQNIAESLAELQKDFFLNPKGKLVPLIMNVVADKTRCPRIDHRPRRRQQIHRNAARSLPAALLFHKCPHNGQAEKKLPQTTSAISSKT